MDNASSAHRQRESLVDRPHSTDRLTPRRDKSGSSDVWSAEYPAIFSGLAPEECQKICASARTKEFARGAMMYIEEDPVNQILLLTSGFAKITKFGQNGTEVILRLAVPGDVLGVVGMFSTGKHCKTAQALRSCRALVWEVADFKAHVERVPLLHHNLVRIFGEYLLELQERFREVAAERVGPRVARQVVRLLNQIGRPVNGAVEIGLSRQDLALMTGTTLFTVSRLFSAWQERGMVRPRREAVTICDVESLRALSEEG